MWPDPPLHIVLVEPLIPPNTGNISRLCAATGTMLHLIEPLGFDISEKQVRRAGLDYWNAVDLRVHPSFEALCSQHPAGRKFLFSTAGKTSLFEAAFQPGDFLVFGKETTGLPDELIRSHPPERVCNIPIQLDSVRSLNLSNCAAIALYEALRQIDGRVRSSP